MAREYVPIFFDWLDVTQDLTAEEKGNLIDAVVSYASGNEYEHLLVGSVKIAFRFLKGQVDRNSAISEARSEARKNKTEQNVTNVIKLEQSRTNLPKEKEKEKEKDNKKENKKEVSRFAPPSVEEVKAYCQERENNVDPEAFVAFYSSKGWKVGNNPMRDWKAAIITWEKRGENRGSPRPTKTVIAQQYEQRDYSGIQDELMEQQDRDMEEYLRKEKGAGNNAESNGTADVLPDDSGEGLPDLWEGGTLP